MPANFTTRINFDGQFASVTIIPTLRQGGMQFEINIAGIPRFYMRWGVMDRYEVIKGQGLKLPENLVLAVSDAIEARVDR